MKIFYTMSIILISMLFLCSVHSLNAQVTDTVHIKAKWNMVSLPLKVQDAHYLKVFPGALSQPFEHSTGFPPETLKIGKSYWMLFESDTTYLITGERVHSVTKELWAGWNMIGTLSYPIPISNIQTDPPGIIISDFFEYNAASGYEKANTIIPGSGYWVKVNQAGYLILNPMGYPCPGISTVEYESKVYNTVQIGNQCWLKENLDVGTMIQGIGTAKDNGIIEKYCYNDSIENCDKYGGLYQWNESMQYTIVEGTRGICPPGWHVPTLGEFDTLSNTVDGDGNVLKEIGEGTGNGAGTNKSGFSALLAGYQYYSGDFYGLWDIIYSWSSTEFNSSYAYNIYMFDKSSTVYLEYPLTKDYGFSVRCLKD